MFNSHSRTLPKIDFALLLLSAEAKQPKHFSLINHEMKMINLRNEQIICNFMQSLDSHRRLRALVKFQFSSSHSTFVAPTHTHQPPTRELSLMKIELHQEQVEIKHENTEQMRINCRKKFVTFFPDIIRKICERCGKRWCSRSKRGRWEEKMRWEKTSS